MGLRDDILGADDLSCEEVEVPEWGVTVRVKSPTVKERARLVAKFIGDDGQTDLERMYPALLIATVVDENGERLFTDDDIDALNTKSGAAVERVAKAALRVAGMDDTPAKVADRGKGRSNRTANAAT